MSTKVRPVLSPKNKYWIERHRYYELKHFCLQYPMWKTTYLSMDGLSKRPETVALVQSHRISDPTEKCAMVRNRYLEKMKMVEQSAIEADPDLASYILKAVTEERSYTYLKTNLNMPCCKDTFYDRYRKFFWILSSVRN